MRYLSLGLFESFLTGGLRYFVALVERVVKFGADVSTTDHKVLVLAGIVTLDVERPVCGALTIFVRIGSLTLSGDDASPRFLLAFAEK